jgi:hypothetical protein
MNRPLRSRDRGHREFDSKWPSGSTGTLLGASGLVGGAADDLAGDRRNKKARVDWTRAGREGRRTLFRKPINSFSIFTLGGFYGEPHLFTKGAADKATNRMGLPASEGHNIGQRCTSGPLQQVKNLFGLAALAGFSGLPAALGCLLGLSLGLAFALCGAGLFRRVGFVSRNLGSGRFLFSGHVLSFRDLYRGDDIHHSALLNMQEDSTPSAETKARTIPGGIR